MSGRNPELLRIMEAYRRRPQASGERYSSHDRANGLRLQEVRSRMISLLPGTFHRSIAERRFLEIGCGSGYWLRQFIEWGARPSNVIGIDLIPERLARAQTLCAGISLQRQNAAALAFRDNSFDLVLQATVFTSILDTGMKALAAGEMVRVLRPGGFVLWYDFFLRNPWNPDVRGICRAEITELFPACRVRLQRLTLAPPLGRILSRLSGTAYRIGSAARIFSTHYLGLIEKI